MAKRLLPVLFLLLLLPLVSFAAWPEHLPRLDHFSLVATGGRSEPNWHGQADVTTIAFSITHAFSPRTELDLTVQPFAIVQPRSWFGYSRHENPETVRAISGSVMLRRWWRADSSTARPYFEVGIGPMEASRRVPAATSRFNVVSQGGFGLLLHPNRPFPMFIGYRMAHISNGGYAPRNPGLNAHSFLIGFRGDFKPSP